MKKVFRIASIAMLAVIGFSSCEDKEMMNQILSNNELIENLKKQVLQAQDDLETLKKQKQEIRIDTIFDIKKDSLIKIVDVPDSLKETLQQVKDYLNNDSQEIYEKLDSIKNVLNSSDAGEIDEEYKNFVQDQLKEIYSVFDWFFPNWREIMNEEPWQPEPTEPINEEEILGTWVEIMENYAENGDSYFRLYQFFENGKYKFSDGWISQLKKYLKLQDDFSNLNEVVKTITNNLVVGKYEIVENVVECLIPTFKYVNDTVYKIAYYNDYTLWLQPYRRKDDQTGLFGNWYRWNEGEENPFGTEYLVFDEVEGELSWKEFFPEIDGNVEDFSGYAFVIEEEYLLEPWGTLSSNDFKNFRKIEE